MEDFVLLIPDAFTPSQFADLHRSSYGSRDEGVKNLLRALLEDALRGATGVRVARARYHEARYPEAVLRRARNRKRRDLRRQREALEWLFSDSDNGVFAFVNICAALKIDARALRGQTRRALEKATCVSLPVVSKTAYKPRSSRKIRRPKSILRDSSDSTFEQTFQRIAQL